MNARVAFAMMCAIAFFAQPLMSQEPKEKVLAGWMGVFPEILNYQRTFEKPKVDMDKKLWQQTAHYEWTGGRAESIRVTLLRDAAEAKKYQFNDANPLPKDVEKIKVGERDAWNFPDGKLAIKLADDRLLILEATTWKLFRSNLPDFAKSFPLDACSKALDNPPRTDFARKVETFRALRKGMSLAQVREWAGEAEKDIGSGIHILTYRLDDGTRVLIGFPDFNRLIYVKHEDKAGKVVDLVK